MNNIPAKLRRELAADPEYSSCALRGIHSACGGRITWEHALTYSHNQIQERWAIIPLCQKHHGVGPYLDAGTIEKERNVWIALNRATDEELIAVSKAIDYLFERERLNKKYGVYRAPKMVTINYD